MAQVSSQSVDVCENVTIFTAAVVSQLEDVLREALKGETFSNKQQVQMALTFCVAKDEEGGGISIVAVGQDIAIRKQVEQERDQVADDLTRLIDSANAPIFGIDVHGMVTEWNQTAFRLTGYTKAEVQGKHLVNTYITPEYQVAVNNVLQEALNGRETANFEFPLFGKRGQRVEVLLNASSRLDSNAAIVGVVGVGQDITGMKAAEKERQLVADDLTRLIDSANAPIFGIDVHGMVTEWNQTAFRLTGYTKEEVLGKHLVDTYITPEYQVAVNNVLQEALGGTEMANFEFPLFGKTGQRVEVLLNASSRRDANGSIVGMVGVGQDITGMKAAEKERQLVADDLTRLIDSANAPIFGIDVHGMVTEWNQTAFRLTGYTKAEVLGKHLVNTYITPEYQVAVNNVLQEALGGTEMANFEFPLFGKTGQRVDVLLNASSRLDADGAIVGVVGVGQDITGMKAAEKERQLVADDLTRLIDSANAPIFGIDVHGMVTEWNQTAFRLTGYTKEEVLGKHLVDTYITPEYQVAVSNVLQEALGGTEMANFEFPLFGKTGQRVEVLLNASSRRDANGSIVGMVGVGQDITGMKAAEKERQLVADDLTRLIDSANAPIFGIDVHGMVTEWNQTACRLTGYTKEEVLGKHLVDTYITPEYQTVVRKVLEDALSGTEMSNFEFPLFGKTGQRVEVLLNASSRRDADGAIVGVVGVGQDITGMKAAEKHRQLVADDLTRLIDSANAPIFGIDVHGMVTEWNQTAFRLTGYTKAEVLGKHLVDTYITPEYQVAVNNVLQEALDGREMANFEFPLFGKRGHRVDVLLNASSRLDADGAIVGVVGVGQDITGMKAAEKERQLVADDLTRLIDSANAPIFGIDVHGMVTEWNQTACRLTGYTREEVLGKHLVDTYITPEYQVAVSNVLQEALGGTEMANFEFPLFGKTGQRVEVLLNASSRRDANGAIVGMVGVGQDITGMKAAEKERQLVADDLTRLIDSANAPIFGIDVHGMVTEWNQTACRLTGYTKEEVLGKHLVDTYITPEYQTVVRKVLEDALSGTEMSNFEFPLFGKTGQRVEVLLNASSRRDADGAIVGVVGVGQDITGMKAAEKERQLVADDLTRLIDSANAPIFGIDVHGMVTEWNQTAFRLTGYTKAEVLGKHLVDTYITPEYQVGVNNVLQEALGGTEMANFEFPLFGKTGQRVDVLLNASSRLDANGAIVGVVGVGQDITGMKAAEKERQLVADDLTRLIDSANAPIFGIDVHGMVTEWNQTAFRLTGYTKEEVLGKHLVDTYITPEYQVAVNNVLQEALGGTEMANFEFPLFGKTGQRVEVLLNASSRRDADGAIVGVVGVGQDITGMKAAEKERQLVADDLTRLIDSANAPIFGIDVHGKVTEWNQTAFRLTGYTKEEVLGKHLVDTYITPEYQVAVNEVLQEALGGTEWANFEFPLFGKTGQRVDVLLNASSRLDADGAIVGVVGVGQDITGMKAAEKERQLVADDLTRLIDSANAPIFGIDVHGKVTEWNQTAFRLTGYTKAEVLGKHLVDTYITPEYQVAVNNVLQEALDGREMANFEFPLFGKRGHRVDVLLNASSRLDADGAIVGVVGVGQDITGMKAAEKERQLVADDLTRLIDSANAPIFGIDVHGMVTEWNQTACRLTGYTKEEVLGKHLVDTYITPEYQVAVSNVLQEALGGTEMANFEFPLFGKTGQRVEVLLNASSRRDANGAIVGVVGVGQDITGMKAAEKERQLVADDLTRLIDSANAPIFGIDVHGMVTEWNQTACRLTGYTKEEVLGKHLVDTYITPEYQTVVRKVLEDALSGTEMSNFEFPLFGKTGQRVEVLLNASSRRDADGAIMGVVGVGQDITGMKAAEKERQLVADDLTRLIDSANAPIFGIDVHGMVTEWNQTAFRLTGYTKEEVLGKHLVDTYITPEYQVAVNNVLQEALGGTEMANFEFPLFGKTGQRVDVLLNASSRLDADGAIVGVVGVGQDITGMKAAEKERQLVADDLTRLIDSANAPIFGIDVHGMVTEWNQTAFRLTGYTKEEVLGKHLVDTYITPEYQVAVNNVLQEALGGTEMANFEFPLFGKTGQRVEVLLNASSRRDADGAIVGVVGVGQDITGMKAAEKERQLVADDLTRLIDSANAPIFGIDVHGKVTEWNQTAFRLTGYTKEEVLGKHLVDTYITTDYQVAVNEVLQEALGGTEWANFEFPLFGKTGQRVDVLLNASSRLDANGAIVGVVGVGQDITGMKAAEKERQLVADDLTRLIDSANAPIFGIDVHGMVTEWNQTAFRLTGYTKEEVLGKHLVDTYITPEYQVAVNNVLQEALGGTEMANFEFPLFGKTGQRVEVLLNASSRRDANGSIVGMVGVGQDITGMKAAEKERQLVADDLTRLIDSANAPIFGIDVHGKVTEWNQTACRLTGFTKEEVLGKHLVDTYITPEYQVAVNEVLQEALGGTEWANFEFPLFGKTGQRVDVLLNASSRLDANGAIVGVVGVGQDITGMKAAEKERQLVADDLTRLIDSANAPIFGIDVHGMVTEWNQTAFRLTGYTKVEVLGKHLVDTYITPEYQVAVKHVLQEALRGTEMANFEFPMFGKTGQRVDVLLNASSRRDADGAIVGVVGVGQDITGMKAAEKGRQLVADDLTRLIDSANAPIFGIDVQGMVTEWNQTACRLTGYTKAEVLGKHLVDTYITPEYQVAVNNVLQGALGGTETANFEFPMFGKRGHRVDVLLNASSRLDADGAIVGVVGVGQDITGMKAAEKERKLVADDLTRLIDSANAPIFGIDVHGKVTEWNQTAFRLTGYTKEEVLGKHLVDTYITPEYQVAVNNVLQEALGGTEMANFEFPLFGKTGQRVEVLLNASSRRDANGSIVGMVGVGQDITGMKAAEKERQLVADDLTRLIDSANAPIFGIDVHGMVSEWNQTACRLTGYTKAEVLGKHLVDTYITPEYQTVVRKVLEDALSGTEMSNFEFPLFGKTGQRVEVLLNASSRRDAGGAIVGVVGVGQDITGMKAAEKHRQLVADDLTRLIDSANAPIFGIDVHGMVTEWNQTACRLTGFTKEEVLGKHLVDTYITPEYQVAVSNVLQEALSGTEMANFEFPLFGKIGQRVEVLLNASARRDADGAIVGMVGVGQDITGMKVAEKERDQAKTDYLAFICHELRNPLNGINGLVDLCLGSDFLNTASLMPEEFVEQQTEQLDLIKCIKTSSDLMKKVVDDVLDFSKLEANSMEMETVDFDIRQTIQDICREQVLARGCNPANQVQFLIDVDKSVPQHVNGDPTRFCQVVLNLLSNAMKFTVDGSVSLTVCCILPPAHIEESERAQMVVVEATVKDTGLGMDPSYMSVLFKPYSQEKASVARQHGGTGLGLPICKSIVERMGGSISVTSQLHQGSAFTFTAMFRKPVNESPDLNFLENTKQGTKKRRRINTEGKASKKKKGPPHSGFVMLVEDNMINQKVAKKLLEREHFKVDVFDNGLLAVHAFEKNPSKFDAILMDVFMPVMDGHEASKRIIANGYTGPIIGLTANATPDDRNACLACGMCEVVTKPFKPKLLTNLLVKLIGEYDLRRERDGVEKADGTPTLNTDLAPGPLSCASSPIIPQPVSPNMTTNSTLRTIAARSVLAASLHNSPTSSRGSLLRNSPTSSRGSLALGSTTSPTTRSKSLANSKDSPTSSRNTLAGSTISFARDFFP